MSKILVTGGCGYIGSHTIVDLIDHGFEVISIDNNINSFAESLTGVEKITGKKIKNYCIDLCDLDASKAVFEEHKDIQGLIHFAALKSVPESVDQPIRYHHNNINSLLNVLQCIKEYNVPNFIFSSSCSVYGNTQALPVIESTPLGEAECPYARTKQFGEQIIWDFAQANPKNRSILLRYFNPGGAHETAIIGEKAIKTALNLIPVITETAIGKRQKVSVFGSDYDTRDGSCIRDYIHVMDLANAHTKALQFLEKNEAAPNYEIYNLGIGQGVTVLEAIKAFEKVTGKALNYEIGPRRAGDVVAVYADYSKAATKLGWKPQLNIEDIMRTAWAWEEQMAKA